MMAKLAKLPRDDSNWAYEIKWDGVRAVCYCEGGRITLTSEPARRDVAVPRAARSAQRALGSRELSSTARSSRSTKRATELRHPPAPDARGLGERSV